MSHRHTRTYTDTYSADMAKYVESQLRENTEIYPKGDSKITYQSISDLNYVCVNLCGSVAKK